MKVTFVERKVTLKDTFKEKFCAKLNKFDKIFDETAKEARKADFFFGRGLY